MKHTSGLGANPIRSARLLPNEELVDDPPLEAIAHHPKESLGGTSRRAASTLGKLNRSRI